MPKIYSRIGVGIVEASLPEGARVGFTARSEGRTEEARARLAAAHGARTNGGFDNRGVHAGTIGLGTQSSSSQPARFTYALLSDQESISLENGRMTCEG